MGMYMGCDNVEIMLNDHECYYSKNEVLEQIKENEKTIVEHKQKLFAMVCGNIKDLFGSTDEEGNTLEPIDAAGFEFKNLFEDECCGIEYLIYHNVILQQLYDNWDKRWSEFDGYGLNSGNNDKED